MNPVTKEKEKKQGCFVVKTQGTAGRCTCGQTDIYEQMVMKTRQGQGRNSTLQFLLLKNKIVSRLNVFFSTLFFL